MFNSDDANVAGVVVAGVVAGLFFLTGGVLMAVAAATPMGSFMLNESGTGRLVPM